MRNRAILLGVIALAAFAVRLAPWGYVLDGGTVYFFDGDSYLHIRKILLQIAAFPRFVTFDYFEGYPAGTVALWTPVLDWLLALASLIIGLGHPSERTVELLAAFSAPAVGGMTIYAIYAFARRVFDEATALVAAALVALMFGHVIYTVLGRPDNEMTEPLMAMVLYASYLRLQADGERRSGLLCALAALGLMLLWRGGTLWVMLMWAAMLMDVTLDFIERKSGSRHSDGALVFGMLALLLAPLCIFNVWGRQAGFSFNVISWFHVALYGGAAMALYAYGEAARRRSLPALIGLLGAGAAAMFMLGDNMLSGLGMLGVGRVDPWIQSIEEYRPMFTSFEGALTAGVGYAGWCYWLMPLAAGHIAWSMWRARKIERQLIFFIFFVLAVLGLSALRIRFAHIMALGAAMSGAYCIMLVYRRLEGRAASILIATGVALALMFPSLKNDYYLTMKHPGVSIKGCVLDAMRWMRDNTPEPTGTPPGYGVMAMWNYAGWIERVAGRPAIATLYGTETSGMRESAEFYLAQSEDEALDALKKSGARYVVVTQAIGELPTMAKLLDRQSAQYAELAYSEAAHQEVYRPGDAYLRLVSTSMLLGDGAAQGPLGHLRLVYESPETLKLRNFPAPVARLKIFERVPGVTLNVSAQPNAAVTVSAIVRTNLGREFDYRLSGAADGAGRVSFSLPYAMSETSAPSAGLAAPYTVRSGGRSTAISVSEGDLMAGAIIRAAL